MRAAWPEGWATLPCRSASSELGKPENVRSEEGARRAGPRGLGYGHLALSGESRRGREGAVLRERPALALTRRLRCRVGGY